MQHGLERAQGDRPHDAGEQEVPKRRPHATIGEVAAQRFDIAAECLLDSWPPRQRVGRQFVETGDAFDFKPGETEQCIEHAEQDDEAQAQHKEESDAGADRTAKQSDDRPAK